MKNILCFFDCYCVIKAAILYNIKYYTACDKNDKYRHLINMKGLENVGSKRRSHHASD